jgi:hypothetical protein
VEAGLPAYLSGIRVRVTVSIPNKAVRIVDVLLHNLGTDEIENIGKAAEYGEAIALAHRSGKVPKGWNVAVTDANDERIVVACKKGVIVA